MQVSKRKPGGAGMQHGGVVASETCSASDFLAFLPQVEIYSALVSISLATIRQWMDGLIQRRRKHSCTSPIDSASLSFPKRSEVSD